MNKSALALANSGTAASSADGPITVINAAIRDHHRRLDRQQVAMSFFVEHIASDDESIINHDQFFDVAGVATSTSSIIKQRSTATETPDIGILGKNTDIRRLRSGRRLISVFLARIMFREIVVSSESTSTSPFIERRRSYMRGRLM